LVFRHRVAVYDAPEQQQSSTHRRAA